jgi:hypothetical protein
MIFGADHVPVVSSGHSVSSTVSTIKIEKNLDKLNNWELNRGRIYIER